jgi:hypothetical protein
MEAVGVVSARVAQVLNWDLDRCQKRWCWRRWCRWRELLLLWRWQRRWLQQLQLWRRQLLWRPQRQKPEASVGISAVASPRSARESISTLILLLGGGQVGLEAVGVVSRGMSVRVAQVLT